MIREAIDKIQAMAVASAAPHKIQLTDDKVMYLHGDKQIVEGVPPPRRNHTVHDFSDFCEFVRSYEAEDSAGALTVFHNNAEIVAVLDMNERRDFVRLPLHLSERGSVLVNTLFEAQAFSPAKAVKLLRYTLHGTGPQTERVLGLLRTLDFHRQSVGKVDMQHGRESLGRQVEAAVQGRDQIPDQFAVQVALYNVPGLRSIVVTVELGLALLVQEEKIEIGVLGDQMAVAFDAAQLEIGKKLRGLLPTCPIYHGKP